MYRAQQLRSHPGGGPTVPSPGRHIVPAQVHVNGGALASERETDILDDELPIQDGQSGGSMGTLSSLDGVTNTSESGYPETLSPLTNGLDKPYSTEPVLNGGGYPYEAANRVIPVHSSHSAPIRPSYSAQEGLAGYQREGPHPAWSQQVTSAHCGCDPSGLFRSQSFPDVEPQLPQAPTRGGSSREAVQRGLNSWQQQQPHPPPRQQERSPLQSLARSKPSPQLSAETPVAALPEFPRAASQQEIEQSIETLNMLMLDLEPASAAAPLHKSQSVPGAWPGASPLSSQPLLGSSRQSHPLTQSRSGYIPSGHSLGTPELVSSGRPYSPYDYQLHPAGSNQSFHPKSPASSTFLPSPHSSAGPQEPPASLPGLIAQPQLPPKETTSDPSRTPEEEPLNLEGLVAHRVAEPRSYVESVARTAVAGPRAQDVEPKSFSAPAAHAYGHETPLRNGTPGGSFVSPSPLSTSSPILSADSTSVGSFPSVVSSDQGPRTPFQPMLDSSIRSGSLGQPSPAALSYQSSSPVPVGGSSYNSPDYSLQPFSSSPESQGQPQYSAASVHMVPGSPQARHRTVGTNTPPSPGFGRRAVNPTMAAPGSPSLSHRQVMGPSGPGFHGNVVSGHPASAATTPGSPSLGRHPVGSHQVPGLHSSVVTTPGSPSLGRHPGAHQGNLASSLHSNAVISPGSPSLGRHLGGSGSVVPGSPSLDRHAAYGGYSTPEDRRPTLSRQSSASGYQAPSTPSFPVSPAYYPGLSSPATSPSPDSAAFRQGSPTPALPEKRRMSVGDRAGSLPNYATINGKVSSSPVANGMASGSSTVSFSHTLPDFSKYSMPDNSPETRAKVKFVQDTSKYWYKPEISREQAIALLKDQEPGAFIIRDSHSFRGAYGLAMKVSSPPPTITQQGKKGDMTHELVRHFLIETGPRGVKLKGCPNEPNFGSLSALVYQHSVIPLALPCKLVIPSRDPTDESKDSSGPANSTTDLLKQGAACNVLFVNSVDMESLTGPQAISKATSETLAADPTPAATIVHFKVSAQGITLTDNQRKLFFRRHYPLNTVTFCDLDPQERKWMKTEGGAPAKLFGFVARKQGSTTDNACHLFAELDPNQPASAIVNFVSKVMLSAGQKR
ncbi:tensin-1 isoform X33 [Mus musculus]|nr:tensin-1 isoform X33 [Mus musculus]